MWWNEDELARPKTSSSRSQKVLKNRRLGKSSRTFSLRSESATRNRTAIRPNRREVDAFRSLDLSSDQRRANLELSAASLDHGSPHPLEIKRLEADVQSLEMVVRKVHAERQQQESDLARLREECSRWLLETQMLSAQLSVETERRNQITRQYEIVRAELQAICPLGGAQSGRADSAIFEFPETRSTGQDSQGKAA